MSTTKIPQSVAALIARTRSEQGLSPTVTDPVVLGRVVAMLDDEPLHGEGAAAHGSFVAPVTTRLGGSWSG